MLGDKIREYRKLRRLSQEELSEKLGVSRQSISLWENNQTQPSLDNIVVLARVFGISADDLLSDNGEPAKNGEKEAQASGLFELAKAQQSHTGKERIKENKSRTGMVLGAFAILVAILALLAVWWIAKEQDSSTSAETVYAQISPSVVEIVAKAEDKMGLGTGFFIDENGTIVTNYHVIEGFQSAEICMANGAKHQVTSVLGYDADRDLAILSTACKNSKPLSIRTTQAKTGEKVYALGSSSGLTGTLSDGIVSAINREVEGNTYVQTTAPISQGNSGGPLVDETGAVIGIVCAYFASGQNLNLAIPAEEINKIFRGVEKTLEELFPKEKQEVEWLSDYRFSYYAKENKYVLLFQLADNQKKPVAESGIVKIRVVNDDNITVYNKTHDYTLSDFETWTYDGKEEKYVATIYISPESITKGSTAFGTVYFKVSGVTYDFDECTVYTSELPKKAEPTKSDTQQGGVTPLPSRAPTQATETCLDIYCENPVAKRGEYCEEHKCATPGCRYSRDNLSEYCSLCECFEVGCKNGSIENGVYCVEHTCLSAGCTSSRKIGSQYCYSHGCVSGGCENEHISGGDYCAEHTCDEMGCSNKKSAGNYCYVHEK